MEQFRSGGVTLEITLRFNLVGNTIIVARLLRQLVRAVYVYGSLGVNGRVFKVGDVTMSVTRKAESNE